VHRGVPIGVVHSRFVAAPILLFLLPFPVGATKMALSRLEVMVSLMLVPSAFALECVAAAHFSTFEDRELHRILLGDQQGPRVLEKLGPR
jgi:hypothetical protein